MEVRQEERDGGGGSKDRGGTWTLWSFCNTAGRCSFITWTKCPRNIQVCWSMSSFKAKHVQAHPSVFSHWLQPSIWRLCRFILGTSTGVFSGGGGGGEGVWGVAEAVADPLKSFESSQHRGPPQSSRGERKHPSVWPCRSAGGSLFETSLRKKTPERLWGGTVWRDLCVWRCPR